MTLTTGISCLKNGAHACHRNNSSISHLIEVIGVLRFGVYMPLNIILDSPACLTMVGSLREGKGEYLSDAATIGCLKTLENPKLQGDVQGDRC